MRTVAKVLIINVAILLGCVVAMIVVPSDTSSVVFFGCCAVVFVAMNVWLFVIPRYRWADRLKASKNRRSATVAWWVIAASLSLDLLMKYGH
jgi:hypothetical protein